jgi:phosphohistidine phosphatase
LNKRGKRDAPRMGRVLAARLPPMVITASPARRAQLTLQGLCRGWPVIASQAHLCAEALYTFSRGDLASWIAAQDNALTYLFIIGHNPALTDLVNDLAGRVVLENLPTAGYARLRLNVERWDELHIGCAQLEELLLPRHLEE